jgi:hypothetical protein
MSQVVLFFVSAFGAITLLVAFDAFWELVIRGRDPGEDEDEARRRRDRDK